MLVGHSDNKDVKGSSLRTRIFGAFGGRPGLSYDDVESPQWEHRTQYLEQVRYVVVIAWYCRMSIRSGIARTVVLVEAKPAIKMKVARSQNILAHEPVGLCARM